MILFLFGLLLCLNIAIGADITCQIISENDKNYICPDMSSGSLSVQADDIGCAQTKHFWGIDPRTGEQLIDPETNQVYPSEAALEYTIGRDDDFSCAQFGDDYVIDCILFAGLGKVGGSCGELTDSSKPCHFEDYEADDFVVHPPENLINTHCIGTQKCDILVDQDGFLVDGQYRYEFDDEDEKIFNLGVWSFKMLFQCVDSQNTVPEEDEPKIIEIEAYSGIVKLELDVDVNGFEVDEICVSNGYFVITPNQNVFGLGEATNLDCDNNMFWMSKEGYPNSDVPKLCRHNTNNKGGNKLCSSTTNCLICSTQDN
jgi:hypothetical protein